MSLLLNERLLTYLSIHFHQSLNREHGMLSRGRSLQPAPASEEAATVSVFQLPDCSSTSIAELQGRPRLWQHESHGMRNDIAKLNKRDWPNRKKTCLLQETKQ